MSISLYSILELLTSVNTHSYSDMLGLETSTYYTGPPWQMTPGSLATLLAFPFELLSFILLLAQSLERSDNDEREEAMLPPFEVRVSHVSRSLRDLALSIGQMWSSIVIEPGYSPSFQTACLDRSKGCLLDVCLRDCDETSDITNRIVSEVFRNSSRWRTCVIVGGLDSSVISQMRPLDTSHLEYIQITVHPPTRARKINELWMGRVLAGGYLSLRTVHLENFAVHFARPPLTRISSLRLDFSSHLPFKYRDFRNLLVECGSLRFLSVSGEIVDTEPWPPEDHSPVVLPYLLDIHIFSLLGNVYSGILLTLEAPLLQSLDLEDVQNLDLDQFLETPKHFPNLVAFSFRESFLTPAKCNKVFVTYPSLEEMTMYGFVFNPFEVLKLVSRSLRDQGVALPHRTTVDQGFTTLGAMLDENQRESLCEDLRSILENDESILELDPGAGWSYQRFFNWLQNFITAESLSLVEPH